MFKILNKLIALQWFLLIILLLFSGYQLFTQSRLTDPSGFPILYHSIYSLLSQSHLTLSISIFSLLILTLVGIQYYFSKNNFSSKSSFLPSIAYVSFLLFSGNFKIITPIFFTSFILISIILLNDSYTKGSRKSNILYSGMLIGLSMMIDPSSFFFFIFLIASMIINTVINHKDIIISLLGILTVGIYFIAFYFFTDHIDLLWGNFEQIKFFSIFTTSNPLSTLKLIFLPINIIILLYLIVKISLLYESKVIVMRKKMFTLNILFLCLVGTILFSGIAPAHFYRYFFIPLSLLISILVQNSNKYFVYEILIAILYIGICL